MMMKRKWREMEHFRSCSFIRIICPELFTVSQLFMPSETPKIFLTFVDSEGKELFVHIKGSFILERKHFFL